MPLPDETQNPEETETPEPNEAEQPPTEEQANEEAEAEPEGEDAGENEEGTADEGAKADAQPEAEEKRKRAGGWQRKIERLERLNEQLVQQLSSRQGASAAAAKPEAEKTSEEKASEYIESLVEKRLAVRDTQQREKAVVTDFQRRTAEVRASHDDFDDVVTSADIPVASPLGQALLTSEHGPAIMYQLAKSPAELARLSALPPLDAAREIGRLEAKLASSTPPAKTNGAAKRPPAPPTSVSGSTSNTRSLEELPLSEYKRAMRSGRR
jgi:hypothetical protein